MATKKELSSNIWKYFLFILTQRRHFIPLLAIFFLTLPDTNAQQIGIYTAIGYLFSFLFEIPSGYFADKFGHKRTLILSKILMILSMLSFVLAKSLSYFIAGSVFLALAFSFASGTKSAFMHDTLIELKREKEYTKIMSKIGANVSVVSMILTILLPFLTKISIVFPLKVNLVFDTIGFFVALSFISPKRESNIMKSRDPESLLKIIKTSSNKGFYVFAIFTGAITGFMLSSSPFKYVYLESLGYPVILVGFIMGLSRLVWFMIGHNAHLIEKKIGVANLLKYEIIIFPLIFILVAAFSNPYIVGLTFIISTGYFWGRKQIITNYFITHFIKNRYYKATMLSVKVQVETIFQFSIVFIIGFLMRKSFKLGYLTLGIGLFVILALLYPFIKKYLIKHNL
ncbi:MFS transporter [Candidatus Woesearchaeota archaeon]|nr:MFS transporter [Candidatus Woesearchaeota archaeon]